VSDDWEEFKINGPDDAIAILGDVALWSVIDSAPLAQESARRDAEEAILDLRAQRKQAKSKPDEAVVILNCDDAIESIAAIADEQERALLVGQLAAVRIPGLNKALIEKEVRRERQAVREDLDEAKRIIQHERYIRVADTPLKLVRDLAEYYRLWRSIPPGADKIEAVFAMNTHTYDVFDTVSYLGYTSATPACGKTVALERHEGVCAKAYMCASPSPAVIFRLLDRDHPTFILDEAKWIQGKSDRAAEVTEIFNLGYKKGQRVPRCVEHGEGLVDFNVFGPKIVARIGNFTGTLLSRSILIHLTKAYGLPQSWRRRIETLSRPLQERCQAYATQYRAALAEMYEKMPEYTYWEWLSGRESEIFTPLLIHARLIAGQCGEEGEQFQREFQDIVRRFSAGKAKLTIAEDWRVGEALEVLEALEEPLETLLHVKTWSPEKWQDDKANRITASALLGDLQDKEIWGGYLEKKKSDRGKTTAIGSFLRSFGTKWEHNKKAGTEYVLLDLARKLAKHVPPELPGPPATGAGKSSDNFRTLLEKLAEVAESPGETSAPFVRESSFTTDTHRGASLRQKGLKVSPPPATTTPEKSYPVKPQCNLGPIEVSPGGEVSPDELAEGETSKPENLSDFTAEDMSNEVVGDNGETFKPFHKGREGICVSSDVVAHGEVPPEADETPAKTGELFPKAAKPGDKQDGSDDKPGKRDGWIEGWI
jgi:hypothetical protein